MFGLFRSKEEKDLGLKNFLKWAKHRDRAGYNFALRARIESSMAKEYSRLQTSEQRLYAAYTSFSIDLKESIKAELTSKHAQTREKIVQTIYDVLSKKGMHGCSHLLKQDYKDDFVLPEDPTPCYHALVALGKVK